MTLPAKDGLWDFGGLVMQSHPSFHFKREYVLKFSIKAANTCLVLIFHSSDEHLGLTSSTKPGAGHPVSLASMNLVIFLSLS